MKKIPLTKGKFALVDAEDFNYFNQWNWSCDSKGYAVRHVAYDKVNYLIRMHHLVLGFIPKNDLAIDHANHNVLDNRKANLRVSTKSQNMQNRRRFKSNINGFKGIKQHGWTNKDGSKSIRFFARVTLNKKTYSSTNFKTV